MYFSDSFLKKRLSWAALTKGLEAIALFFSLYVVFLDQNIKHKEANKECTPNPTPSRLLKAHLFWLWNNFRYFLLREFTLYTTIFFRRWITKYFVLLKYRDRFKIILLEDRVIYKCTHCFQTLNWPHQDT